MKKIILLCSLLFGTILFANEGEKVIYINDVGTGKVIDNGAKEADIRMKNEVLKKLERYKNLRAKKQLTGKEIEEMMELKDYIIDLFNRMQVTVEHEIRRNSALAEQEAISNLGKNK